MAKATSEDPEIPQIISVDDHVIEPPNVWQDRLPAKYKDDRPAHRCAARSRR